MRRCSSHRMRKRQTLLRAAATLPIHEVNAVPAQAPSGWTGGVANQIDSLASHLKVLDAHHTSVDSLFGILALPRVERQGRDGGCGLADGAGVHACDRGDDGQSRLDRSDQDLQHAA